MALEQTPLTGREYQVWERFYVALGVLFGLLMVLSLAYGLWFALEYSDTPTAGDLTP